MYVVMYVCVYLRKPSFKILINVFLFMITITQFSYENGQLLTLLHLLLQLRSGKIFNKKKLMT